MAMSACLGACVHGCVGCVMSCLPRMNEKGKVENKRDKDTEDLVLQKDKI